MGLAYSPINWGGVRGQWGGICDRHGVLTHFYDSPDTTSFPDNFPVQVLGNILPCRDEGRSSSDRSRPHAIINVAVDTASGGSTEENTKLEAPRVELPLGRSELGAPSLGGPSSWGGWGVPGTI